MDRVFQVTVISAGGTVQIPCAEGERLFDALVDAGILIPADCGGVGICGKCIVQFIAGAPAATEADRHVFAQDTQKGMRLACMAHLKGDAVVKISLGREDFSALSSYAPVRQPVRGRGCVAAVDIGTTTIAVAVLGPDGDVRATATGTNSQRRLGADVLSRIQAANAGKRALLKELVRADVAALLNEAMQRADVRTIARAAIAANTAMGHLFMGYDVKMLGVAPFTSAHLAAVFAPLKDLLPQAACDCEAVLLPGISAFVGADVVAGLCHSGVCDSDALTMYVDLGTNAEMALGNRHKLICTSAAAGPAFEGAGISCGVGSVPGAIFSAKWQGRGVRCETIEGRPPVGICGTGVIALMAELVANGVVDETGRLQAMYEAEGFPVAQGPGGEEILLTQRDIRQIQLAKSAIRTGIALLIAQYGAAAADIGRVCLAGGFAGSLIPQQAVAIGLLPQAFLRKTEFVGNGALGGAALCAAQPQVLEKMQALAASAQEMRLAEQPAFSALFLQHMSF